jgi:foldase protein PrsA
VRTLYGNAARAGIAFLFLSASIGATEPPLATVDGVPISHAQLDHRLESSPQAVSIFADMLDGVLLDRYADAHHIVISADALAKKEAELTSKFAPGQFEAILKQEHLTEVDLVSIVRRQMIVQAAIAPDVHVTDADVEAYFEKNHTVLDRPEQVRARHVLVADELTADMIESKLKAGDDFATLARQYSTDSATKDKGGELGFFNARQMVKPVADAAFSLPVGGTSPPVESPFGWHIINVEEKRPAMTATLEGSRAQILATLTERQVQLETPAFLQSLRDEAHVQIYDDRFKDAFRQSRPAPTPPPAKT